MRFTVVAALLVSADALVVGARPALASTSRGLALRQLRAQEAPPPPPPKGKLGATVDQDGKSNVWAVEPSMKVDKDDKGVMAYAPVVAVALTVLLSVPLLPLLFGANPDQV